MHAPLIRTGCLFYCSAGFFLFPSLQLQGVLQDGGAHQHARMAAAPVPARRHCVRWVLIEVAHTYGAFKQLDCTCRPQQWQQVWFAHNLLV